jgi:hypothetical protein
MAEYLLYSDGDNKALRDAIFKATPKAVEQMRTMAHKFKGATDMDTCRNIWNFLKNNIQYVADGDHQKVKLPSALLREKVGDCKSYSLFTAAILENLNINWHYVLSSYTSDPTPQHIYVVCDNGVIIDAVWTGFNQEKKPNYRYKHKVNKNDMKISYIAGIPARRKSIRGCGSSCGCSPCRTRYGTNGIRGTSTMFAGDNRMLGTDSQFMGIGRTGIDWLKAATGREASFGESAEYFLKNRTLAPARFAIEQFIKNNGGGIANFLYNAWLGDRTITLPNGEKYDEELSAYIKVTKPFFTLLDKPAFPFTAEELGKMNTKYTPSQSQNQVFNPYQQAAGTGMTIQQALTPARYNEYLAYNKKRDLQVKEYNSLLDKKRAELDAIYPNPRSINPSNDKTRQKYRDIELKWFWQLGGSPDDFNNAVKEGNTKSPRGKDANYMIMKAAAGTLSAKDIGLVLRGFVSAFGGDKFGLGQKGTFVVSIAGMNNKNAGIGITVEAIVTAYIIPITAGFAAIMPVLGELGLVSKPTETQSGETIDPSLVPKDFQSGSGGGGGNGDEEGGDNTNMLLILGAVAVGGFLLLNK